MKEGLRVAFVASSGGHLEELSKLRAIEKMYDCFLVTEKSDFMINDFCENQGFAIGTKFFHFLEAHLQSFQQAFTFVVVLDTVG